MKTLILLAAMTTAPVEPPLKNWVCAMMDNHEIRCHDRTGTPGNIWNMHPAFFMKDVVNTKI